jgi:hypothetical protein
METVAEEHLSRLVTQKLYFCLCLLGPQVRAPAFLLAIALTALTRLAERQIAAVYQA